MVLELKCKYVLKRFQAVLLSPCEEQALFAFEYWGFLKTATVRRAFDVDPILILPGLVLI